MKKLPALIVIVIGLVAGPMIAMLWLKPSVVDRYLSYKRSGVVTMNNGSLIYPNTEDSTITPFLIALGEWESRETALAMRLVEPGETVVDVGANVGYYTILLAGEVGPSGRVYSFEPEPLNFSLLEKGVRANGFENVVSEQLALSDAPGAIELYLAPSNKGDHRITPSSDERDSIQIDAVRLDDFLPQGTPVHFVKIDTQGAEALIVAGMQRILEENEDMTLVLEFWPEGLHNAGGAADQLLARLADLGFAEIYEIRDEGVIPTNAADLLNRFTVGNREATNIALPKGKMRSRMQL